MGYCVGEKEKRKSRCWLSTAAGWTGPCHGEVNVCGFYVLYLFFPSYITWTMGESPRLRMKSRPVQLQGNTDGCVCVSRQ